MNQFGGRRRRWAAMRDDGCRRRQNSKPRRNFRADGALRQPAPGRRPATIKATLCRKFGFIPPPLLGRIRRLKRRLTHMFAGINPHTAIMLVRVPRSG